MRVLPAAAILTLFAVPVAEQAPAGAAEFASPPARGTVSAARLLSAGPMQKGVYRAGVEVDLAPKTITYWRQPGEAGSPPVFDFSKSRNVAKVEPSFPAPKRIDEAGTVVAGYDEKVIFPLAVTPKDPSAPVTLALTLDYAACGKICLPAKAELSLALPQAGASPFASAIAAAESRVPRKIDAAEARKRFTKGARRFRGGPRAAFPGEQAGGRRLRPDAVFNGRRPEDGRGDSHHRHRQGGVRGAGAPRMKRHSASTSRGAAVASARSCFGVRLKVDLRPRSVCRILAPLAKAR